jgi:hypothetical protein
VRSHLLLALGLTLAQGCDGSRSGLATTSSVHQSADSAAPAPVRHAGVVERIDEKPDEIAVAIAPYQAIFHLSRRDPSFDAYRNILQASIDGHRPVRFTYRVEGTVLTHVEPAPAPTIFDEDVVRTIRQDDPQQPVAILFKRHAAIYFLHRDDPHFAEWLAILEESRQKSLPVRFNYVVAGQRLTAVELKK